MKVLLVFLLFCTTFPILANDMNDEIPTVAFCEMVKNPEKYFEKTIRVTATFTQANEGQYLSDEKKCPLSYDDQIGVSYLEKDEKKVSKNNQIIRKIGSPEFGNQAVVTIVGNLKNQSLRGFAWYRYRFDIAEFETVSHIVEEYSGDLEATKTYLAEIHPDKLFGINFVIPFRPPFHQAFRIEWINLKDFPELKKFTTKKIVFSVLSKETKQIAESRWNTTLKGKIIRIE